MANIKSQKKRIITSEKKRAANAAFKSGMRTAIKKVKVAVAAKDLEAAEKALPVAVALIDKSVKGNVQHINTASRQKSEIMSLVSALKKELADKAEAK